MRKYNKNSEIDSFKEVFLKTLEGDLNAFQSLIKFSTEEKNAIKKEFPEVFLKRSSVLKVLQYFKNKSFEDDLIKWWADIFWSSTITTIERDEDTNEVLFELERIGDPGMNDLRDGELEGMIALMSLPDVWALETAKLYS